MKEAIRQLIDDLDRSTSAMHHDLRDRKLRIHRDFLNGMVTSNEHIIAKLREVLVHEETIV